ncbi:MAG: hypothetical protein ACI9J3_002442 [Parvicellaceae bacterium]|jgi:hypothetical protein
MKIFRKKIKLKRVFLILVVLILCILAFPTYIFVKRVQNDYVLREYVKDKFLDQLKEDMGLYTSSSSTDELKLNEFYIELPDSSLADIESQRDNRIQSLLIGESQLLTSGQWEYVKGNAILNSDTFNIDLRLRGDMPSNYNRSLAESTLRINIKQGAAVNGKRKLSIIKPSMESGYYGFLFYKCFKDQDFLSNKIELVKFYLNGKYAGLRFLQEGFSKELLESASRREGPILRFKNDCVDGQNRYNPHLFPELVAYKEKKSLKSPNLSKNYARALNKYNELVKGNLDVSACFNIDEYARYYALCDVFLSHHSNKCQNIKLYYNPVNDKFEPIAWDPNSFNRYEVKLDVEKRHTQRFGELCYDQKAYPLHFVLAQSEAFLGKYISYLKEYAQNDFIQDCLTKYSNVIKASEVELFRQNFQERFNPENFMINIQHINEDFNQEELLYGCYYSENQLLSLRSISNLPIKIDSVSYNGITKNIQLVLAPNRIVEATVLFDSIESNGKKIKIYSRIMGTTNTVKYKAKVFIKQDVFSNTFFSEKFERNYFDIDSTAMTIKLKNKRLELNENLFIPDLGMKWIIEAGTEVKLNNANIICESQVLANGTIGSPIQFSSNGSGGVLIKNAPNQTVFKNTNFLLLSAPNEGNWGLTGAVTFYNCNVHLDACLFKGAKSEDALNLVRCEFDIINVTIDSCASDALDIDFGKGKITNITVNNAKNDALDFSGSKIKIDNAKLMNIGDKALSAGEMSHLIVKTIHVENAFIAVAAKDSSSINVDAITTKNTEIDFTVYQKKPEYNVAYVSVTNSSLKDPKKLIEIGCTLILDGKVIKGDRERIYQTLYPE